MLTLNGLPGLRERVGEEVGTGAWHEVTQAHIDAFAGATDDHTKIHVDPEHARQTPFGSTIAHGLYTLSLGPKFIHELYEIVGVGLGLNYGFNRVRFITPARPASRSLSSGTSRSGGTAPVVPPASAPVSAVARGRARRRCCAG